MAVSVDGRRLLSRPAVGLHLRPGTMIGAGTAHGRRPILRQKRVGSGCRSGPRWHSTTDTNRRTHNCVESEQLSSSPQSHPQLPPPHPTWCAQCRLRGLPRFRLASAFALREPDE